MKKTVQNNCDSPFASLSLSEEELRKEHHTKLIQAREKNREKDLELDSLRKRHAELQKSRDQILNRVRENEDILNKSSQHMLLLRENLKRLYLEFLSHNQDPVDVDNMTYEELLELQEKIGKVSKGLDQKDIKKLNRQIFQPSLATQHKCTVCQEQFSEGVSLIVLKCRHPFHEECILEWLKEEKVCPLCKTEAV